jgi:hypothetical protein
VIKIIYRDLSPGLHASAETAGRDTIISLLPGLTPEQRRAALRRIRHSGRMGHGPRVSAVQLGLALGLDRIKAITRTGAAVVRLHPAGSTIPVLLLSTAAVVFVLMATVSIHVVPAPKSSDQSPVIGGLVHGPSASAPQAGQVPAPPDGAAAGLPANGGTGHGSRPSAQGGSAAAQGSPAADTPGATAPGSLTGLGGAGSAGLDATSSVNPGLIGTRSASASAGSTGSRGSGTVSQAAGSGSGSTSSGSGSSSSGTSSRPASGSSSGSGASGTSGTGAGRSSGSGAGSGGTSGAGTGGSGGSGTGSSGGGGTAGSGGSGTGSSGGSAGSGGSGSGSTGGSGSSGSSGGSSSGGGTCVTVLVLQACLGL